MSVCVRCRWRDRCLPGVLSDNEAERFASMVVRPKVVRSDVQIYAQGATPEALYFIRDGWVKHHRVTRDGLNLIQDFYSGGDFIGLESLDSIRHSVSAETITSASFCIIPLVRLWENFDSNARLYRRLSQFVSRAWQRQQDGVVKRRALNADAKVADWLYLLLLRSNYYPRDTGQRILIPATKRDISNFLNIAPSTLSRALRRLEMSGAILVSGKEIVVRKRTCLQYIAQSQDVRLQVIN